MIKKKRFNKNNKTMNAAFFLTQHQLEHQRKQQLKEQKRQLTKEKEE